VPNLTVWVLAIVMYVGAAILGAAGIQVHKSETFDDTTPHALMPRDVASVSDMTTAIRRSANWQAFAFLDTCRFISIRKGQRKADPSSHGGVTVSIASRNKRPYEKPHGHVCKVNCCCDKSSPVSYQQLLHDAGVNVVDLDMEVQWWFQCYNCGYICKCEV
jgi:hypothetical protein